MNVLDRVLFRTVRPTDIPICALIEKNSYPPDEMASLSTLQYRQHHAARYFRCAVLPSNTHEYHGNSSACTTTPDTTTVGTTTNLSSNETISFPDKSVDEDRYDDDNDEVIGFICSTRCREFTAESMYSNHVPDGPVLAIHSVVIDERYRRQHIATAMMKDYIRTIQYKLNPNTSLQSYPIEKIVLLSKSNMLSFYVNCGFQVLRPSPIVHGKEQWYDLELNLQSQQQQPITPPPCYIIDSFADPDKIGTGNPAAVVLLEPQWFREKNKKGAEDEVITYDSVNTDSMLTTAVKDWMQTVANEFNLSETAFVWPFEEYTNDQDGDDENKMDIILDEETASSSSKDGSTAVTETVSSNGMMLRYNIRYFTPTIEVPLCGHATLASASVISQTQLLSKMSQATNTSRNNNNTQPIGAPDLEHTNIYFHTAAKDVTLVTNLLSHNTIRQRQYTNITMNFPSAPVHEITDKNDKQIIRSMIWNAFSKVIDTSSVLYMGLSDLGDLLVEITHDSIIKIPFSGIQYNAFCDWEGYSRGVIICCCPGNKNIFLGNKSIDDEVSSITTATTDKSTAVVANENLTATRIDFSKYDFCSRFFAPKSGIDEDPVTGSAHCTLAPYYSTRFKGKKELLGYQNSKRGGVIKCQMSDDNMHVRLTGTAVNAVTGNLLW